VKHPILVAAASAMLAVLLVVLSLMPDTGAGEPRRRTITLVLDTDIGVNSATIAQGAYLAAREYRVDLKVSALSGADGPEAQLDMVRASLDCGASAVLLVPVNGEIAGEAIRLCNERGVKLVLLDTCEAYRGSAPYVGNNHMVSGMDAAEALLRISGAKKLLILYTEDETHAERLKGARLMAEGKGVFAVVHRIPMSGAKPCPDSVRKHILQYPDADAILCLDGALTECAAAEVRELGLKGKVALAGFDCDQTHIACLEDGTVRFTVLRKPLAVGYEGLRRAVEMITWGLEIPVKYVDAAVVMREDILKPENVRLVFPLIH
jgi:ABC-type sugar transport system substrate-binding protein